MKTNSFLLVVLTVWSATSAFAAGLSVGREDYFFYSALLGIDRAVDWLAARPDVDKSRFWYQGTASA